MYCDGAGTMKAIVDKMRVGLIKWRNPDQVKQATAAIAQLAGARQAGAPPNETPGEAA